MTGIEHSLVAKHACGMGLTDQDDCRKCQEQANREKMEPILCSCLELARQRLKHRTPATDNGSMRVLLNCQPNLT